MADALPTNNNNISGDEEIFDEPPTFIDLNSAVEVKVDDAPVDDDDDDAMMDDDDDVANNNNNNDHRHAATNAEADTSSSQQAAPIIIDQSNTFLQRRVSSMLHL